MQLSKNFYLQEFTKSATATRFGIDNTPSDQVIKYLKKLCENVLQPLRYYIGPILITSGYRSRNLNRKIRGSKRSQHVKGQAADFYSNKYSVPEIIEIVRKSNIKFDQMIDEFSDGGGGWVHISVNPDSRKPRGQILKATKDENGNTVYTDIT